MNPYDWCVVNKDVDGKQLVIMWYVDDFKISLIDPAVVTTFIDKLKIEYGKELLLTMKRSKLPDYLRKSLDYSDSGKLKIR